MTVGTNGYPSTKVTTARMPSNHYITRNNKTATAASDESASPEAHTPMVIRLRPVDKTSSKKQQPSLGTRQRPVLEVGPSLHSADPPTATANTTTTATIAANQSSKSRRKKPPSAVAGGAASLSSLDATLSPSSRNGALIIGSQEISEDEDSSIPQRVLMIFPLQMPPDGTRPVKVKIQLLVNSYTRPNSRPRRRKATLKSESGDENDEINLACKVFVNDDHWHDSRTFTKYVSDGDILSFVEPGLNALQVCIEDASDNRSDEDSDTVDGKPAGCDTSQRQQQQQQQQDMGLPSVSSDSEKSLEHDRKPSLKRGLAQLLPDGVVSSPDPVPSKKLPPSVAALLSSQKLPADSLTKPPQVPKGSVMLTPTMIQNLAESVQCSVCLEIQCGSTTLIPCGHSFCNKCSQSLDECPNCREPILNKVQERRSDTIISFLSEVPGILDPEDVKHYRKCLNELSRSRSRQEAKRRKRVAAAATSTRRSTQYRFSARSSVVDLEAFSGINVFPQLGGMTFGSVSNAAAPGTATASLTTHQHISPSIDLSGIPNHNNAAAAAVAGLFNETTLFGNGPNSDGTATLRTTTEENHVFPQFTTTYRTNRVRRHHQQAFQPQAAVNPETRGSGSAEDAICIDD